MSKEFWISKKLTEKAAIILTDMGIDTFEDLVGSIISEEALRKRRDCEPGVSREITNFRRKLLATHDTSSKRINRRAVEILKKISVSEVEWDDKTLQLIRESGAKTIYDLAMINLPAYRSLNHYHLHAYHSIKSKVFEILTEINSSFSKAHEDEEISLNIFVEKPDIEEITENQKYNDEDDTEDISLQGISDGLLQTLTSEERYVIKTGYGFKYPPRSEREIAHLLQLSLDEIKLIKESARRKVLDNTTPKILQGLYKTLRDKKEQTTRARAILLWFADILGKNGKAK